MNSEKDVQIEEESMKNSTAIVSLQVVQLEPPTSENEQIQKPRNGIALDNETIVSISVGVLIVFIVLSSILIFVRIKRRHHRQRESSLEKISQALDNPRQYLDELEGMNNFMIRSRDNREILSRDIHKNYNQGFDFHNTDHRTNCQSTITTIPYYRRSVASQSRKSCRSNLSSLRSFIEKHEDHISFDDCTVKTSHSRASMSRQARINDIKAFLDECEDALSHKPDQSMSPSLESVLHNTEGKSVQTDTSQLTEEQDDVLSHLARIAANLPSNEENVGQVRNGSKHDEDENDDVSGIIDTTQANQHHIMSILHDLASLSFSKFPVTCPRRDDRDIEPQAYKGHIDIKTSDLTATTDHWKFNNSSQGEVSHYNNPWRRISDAITLPDCISSPKKETDIENGIGDDKSKSTISLSSSNAQMGMGQN